MNRRILLAVACLACLSLASVAQDIQASAQSMLQHALQLSDIRAPGAPAFRLTASFSFIDDDLDTVQGTYTETWISAAQWRRDTAVGDLHYVDVGGPARHWLLFPDGFPMQANRLPSMMTVISHTALELHFASISEGSVPGLPAECVHTKSLAHDPAFKFCFEKESGALLEKGLPETRPRNVVNFSCEYGSYREFGGHSFPLEVACFEDHHKMISATVVDLSGEPPRDPALFTPPTGAIELAECSGKTVSPSFLGSLISSFRLDLNSAAWLTVWFVVDVKGRPQNLKVVRPLDKEPHEYELNTLRTWPFKPGTCNSKPMPMPVTIKIPYTPR